MLRSALFYSITFLATVYYGGQVLIAAWLGIPPVPEGFYDRSARKWARLLLRAAGTPVVVRGLEHVPPPPVVFIANHASLFDILALVATLPGTVRFVAKKELLGVPVFGPAMKAAGHIAIDRQNRQAAFDAYDSAAAIIKSGTSAVVFPEGTRSRTGELMEFKKGPFVLAIAAQVPIVPMWIANTFDILPKGGRALHRHAIPLCYGPPIPTSGSSYDDRFALLERTRAAMLELKSRVDAELTDRIGSRA